MSEIKDYGEPWKVGEYHVETWNQGIVFGHFADEGDCSKSDTDRIVACVNALAGHDPEKLDELVEAVRDLIEQAPQEEPNRDDFDMSKDARLYGARMEAWLIARSLAPALAAFEGRE